MGAANKTWNLVIITADDLNADSAGWMGSKTGATPNIDAFAAACHQFRNCHAAVPICQPSRAALMTGRLPHRNGAMGFGPVRSDVTTMTEVMNRNGFLTAAINKIAHMVPREKFDWDVAFEGSGKNPKAMRQHFEQCIKAAAEKRKPFFINANSTDPHGPFPSKHPPVGSESTGAAVKLFDESEVVVPTFLEDLPAVRQEIAQYFSAVRRLDQTFGELIAALKTAGHLEDTVIVFVSDHGMSMPYAKATLYRYATWAPALLRWPGMGTPVVNTAMVSNVDIMPTLLELLDLKMPDGLDGKSWLPLVRGEKQADHDHVFTQVDAVHSGRKFPGRCIRTPTRAYIWNSWADGKTRFRIGAMANRLSWKTMVEAGRQDPRTKARVDHLIYRCAEEFYDNENDPDERENLINDPKCQSEISQMKALLLAHMEKTGDRLVRQFRRVQDSRPKTFFSRWKRRNCHPERSAAKSKDL
jgi:N-sulfoglucosamine sulfohydrolase